MAIWGDQHPGRCRTRRECMEAVRLVSQSLTGNLTVEQRREWWRAYKLARQGMAGRRVDCPLDASALAVSMLRIAWPHAAVEGLRTAFLLVTGALHHQRQREARCPLGEECAVMMGDVRCNVCGRRA